MAEINLGNNVKVDPDKYTDKEKKKLDIQPDQVKIKKRSFGQKLLDTFIEDDIAHVRSYIWTQVMVPTIKRAICEAVNGATQMIFGINVVAPSDTRNGVRFGTSYDRYYDQKKQAPASKPMEESMTNYDYRSIYIMDRAKAEFTIEYLKDYIQQYGFVRVSDLYEYLGKTAPYTLNSWGWYNLESASVRPTRDGFLLDLPKAVLYRQ